MGGAIAAFLLGYPALFSIVNPLSGAFIFREMTLTRTPVERAALAWHVARYSFIVMVSALLAGSFVLAFFGITLAALRVAGGMVVALSAWRLLNSPEKTEQAEPTEGAHDIALFPLTMPITTGPGTIAVAVALGSAHPATVAAAIWFFLGMTAAAAALALTIWVTYRSADRVARLMGPNGSRSVTRLASFLLLCIGVQILITGVRDVLEPLLSRH